MSVDIAQSAYNKKVEKPEIQQNSGLIRFFNPFFAKVTRLRIVGI